MTDYFAPTQTMGHGIWGGGGFRFESDDERRQRLDDELALARWADDGGPVSDPRPARFVETIEMTFAELWFNGAIEREQRRIYTPRFDLVIGND